MNSCERSVPLNGKNLEKIIILLKALLQKRSSRKCRLNDDDIPDHTHRHADITTMGYSNPFMSSLCNIDNSIYWIYLTSSNFLHNLPWINSLYIEFFNDIPLQFDPNLFYFSI